jgi:hypothetical protein
MAEIEKKVVETETWRNVSNGTVIVIKTDKFGEINRVDVRSGALLQITAEDRELNNEETYIPENSVFRNGALAPVRIPDSSDAEEIKSNPNIKSEKDLKEMLEVHHSTFKKNVEEIDNLNLLIRLYELAIREDVSNSKIQALRSRVVQLNPHHLFDED